MDEGLEYYVFLTLGKIVINTSATGSLEILRSRFFSVRLEINALYVIMRQFCETCVEYEMSMEYLIRPKKYVIENVQQFMRGTKP